MFIKSQYNAWQWILLLIGMGMASCTNQSDLMVNTWALDLSAGVDTSKLKAHEKAQLAKSTELLNQFTLTIEFKKDGTMTSSSQDFRKWTHWKVTEGKLWFIGKQGGMIQKVKIETLTKKRLGLDLKDGKITYFNARN